MHCTALLFGIAQVVLAQSPPTIVPCFDDNAQISSLVALLGMAESSCADVLSMCTDATAGAAVRKLCPVTCGDCVPPSDFPSAPPSTITAISPGPTLCVDNNAQAQSLAALAGIPGAVSCPLLSSFCSNAQFGTVLKKLCPVTCSSCPTTPSSDTVTATVSTGVSLGSTSAADALITSRKTLPSLTTKTTKAETTASAATTLAPSTVPAGMTPPVETTTRSLVTVVSTPTGSAEDSTSHRPRRRLSRTAIALLVAGLVSLAGLLICLLLACRRRQHQRRVFLGAAVVVNPAFCAQSSSAPEVGLGSNVKLTDPRGNDLSTAAPHGERLDNAALGVRAAQSPANIYVFPQKVGGVDAEC